MDTTIIMLTVTSLPPPSLPACQLQAIADKVRAKPRSPVAGVPGTLHRVTVLYTGGGMGDSSSDASPAISSITIRARSLVSNQADCLLDLVLRKPKLDPEQQQQQESDRCDVRPTSSS